jgi:hypothetical protein
MTDPQLKKESTMSVAQTRAARRKIRQRYSGGRTTLSVSQSIERERQKAARQSASKKK